MLKLCRAGAECAHSSSSCPLGYLAMPQYDADDARMQLDAKEREDPSLNVRRSFAPAFSMMVQVLKKRRLKEEARLQST